MKRVKNKNDNLDHKMAQLGFEFYVNPSRLIPGPWFLTVHRWLSCRENPGFGGRGQGWARGICKGLCSSYKVQFVGCLSCQHYVGGTAGGVQNMICVPPGGSDRSHQKPCEDGYRLWKVRRWNKKNQAMKQVMQVLNFHMHTYIWKVPRGHILDRS